MATLKDTIIEVLLTGKHLTQEQLDKALALQRQKEIPLRRALVEGGFISEEALLSLLANQLYIPTMHLAKYKFDPEIVRLIPEHAARHYNLIAMSRLGKTLTIAISDPLNVFALDDIKTLTGLSIDTVLSPHEEIVKAVESQYAPQAQNLQEVISDDQSGVQDAKGKGVELLKDDHIELSSAVEESEKPLIVKLVDIMLSEALKRRASDIHIEPEEEGLRVRYRIDGALHEVFTLPRSKQNAVIARIKIISELDITETRVPQDGRFKVRFEGKEVDFRVSGLPVTNGQKFVLRVLDKTNLSMGLDKFGFSPEPLRIFKEAIAKPFGMILVTGPTGSGKSTTLYSVLSQLNTPDKNIITVEDPVEYQIEGITQVQTKSDIGLDFASGLRALLRQSPDIIMIGEIRDSETADIAVKASLTGQLVLSTLHTNDAITSITRLIDMGIEPFLVASSLVMVCAQRLCRKLCPRCKQPYEVPKEQLERVGFTQFLARLQRETGVKKEVTFYRSAGCSYCNNTGFYGRIAILEAFLLDDSVREMVIKGRSIDEIRSYAVEKLHFKTLRDDAFLKVCDEVTGIDEAVRVTTEE